ncbi:hypothetical protein F4821DRAFT_230937 [Hypoxylon rubiginosum]|uniref:Uncharacterized protein n=1 Tax=Hypoxylon rubiginosum TaxID=110542 RepID=A0ACC0DBM6_9PEZI|nr:hypothetical protein F4821DRAFT_230937 [Hypoxylon rubiginosum]
MAPPNQETRSDVLPAYQEFPQQSPYPAAVELPAEREPVELPAEVPAGTPVSGPTVSSPFNFPSDTHLPEYTVPTPSNAEHRPIAIPQIQATPTAPFLDAYSLLLLRHGVTRETWAAFLTTLSGFLAATVSQKAVSHAAEMAQHVGDVPKRFGQDTWAHAKRTGHHIADSAKSGNVIGMIAGAVALPVATAVRGVGAAVSLPFAALGAVVRNPKTPRERAVAYAESANVKWLRRRGLEAHLMDTKELSHALGLLEAAELLQTARAAREYPSAQAQIAALGARVVELEVRRPGPLDLEVNTLWLVVTQMGEEHGHHYFEKEKGKRR